LCKTPARPAWRVAIEDFRYLPHTGVDKVFGERT
jgi:hypothetical protein